MLFEISLKPTTLIFLLSIMKATKINFIVSFQIKYLIGVMMLKKLMPLLILGLFAAGAFLMKLGMDNAVNMANPKKVEKKKAN